LFCSTFSFSFFFFCFLVSHSSCGKLWCFDSSCWTIFERFDICRRRVKDICRQASEFWQIVGDWFCLDGHSKETEMQIRHQERRLVSELFSEIESSDRRGLVRAKSEMPGEKMKLKKGNRTNLQNRLLF
jgi:hypothetical protein